VWLLQTLYALNLIFLTHLFHVHHHSCVSFMSITCVTLYVHKLVWLMSKASVSFHKDTQLMDMLDTQVLDIKVPHVRDKRWTPKQILYMSIASVSLMSMVSVSFTNPICFDIHDVFISCPQPLSFMSIICVSITSITRVSYKSIMIIVGSSW
jgi:hypothetical protein